MAHQLFKLPRPTAISNNLTLVSGAKVGFFLTGTSTPTDTYQDSGLTTPHTNPVVADSAGRLPAIYLDPDVQYRITFTDADDVEIYPAIDPVNDQPVTQDAVVDQLSQSIIGSLLYPRTSAEITLSVTPRNFFYPPGNAKRYGALGDGTGRTPSDDGVDIGSAAWNTWNNTPFFTNTSYSPYWVTASFDPPRTVPFENTDTWDYIGITLAMWLAVPSGTRATYIPGGTYLINLDRAGSYKGLLMMKDQEQTIYGDGPYATIIRPLEDSAFFDANNVGVANAYQLLTLYRVAAVPTNISDIVFLGPDSYGTSSNNLTLIQCLNINGITFRDLWLSSAHRGIDASDFSGDSHAKGITTEYLYGASVYTDANSEVSIDFCNFWSSSLEPTQRGVQALGRGSVTNSRFIGFRGESLAAANGLFSGNYINVTNAAGYVVHVTSAAVITSNQIDASSAAALVKVEADSSIVGNVFANSGDHASVDVGDGSAGSATHIAISGNTFIKTSVVSATDNYSIVAEDSGVSFTGAASASLLISGNTFQGRALQALGPAKMSNNVFDGVVGEETGDEKGQTVLTGDFSTASTTVNITTLLGVGSGALRDQQRLNLVCVLSSGPSHICRIWGLFSSSFNGNATLVATLGETESGGTIAFGTSGSNPTVDITTSGGGTVTYTVTAKPIL